MPPGGPVVPHAAAYIVLISNLMIIECFTQAGNTGTHCSICFLVSLAYEQVHYFVVYFRIV